jgi:hypothetical protein
MGDLMASYLKATASALHDLDWLKIAIIIAVIGRFN